MDIPSFDEGPVPAGIDTDLFTEMGEMSAEDNFSPVDIPIGDYARLELRDDDASGAMRAKIINRATGTVAGTGGGDLRALIEAFNRARAQAKAQGASRLVADVYASDGRGQTRMRVYKRAGFVQMDGSRIVYHL